MLINFTCTVHRKYSNIINPAIIRIRLAAQSHQKLNKTPQGKNQDNLILICIPGNETVKIKIHETIIQFE